jgi:hypothetical protein
MARQLEYLARAAASCARIARSSYTAENRQRQLSLEQKGFPQAPNEHEYNSSSLAMHRLRRHPASIPTHAKSIAVPPGTVSFQRQMLMVRLGRTGIA